MKTKNNQKSVHQHIHSILSHRLSLLTVLFFMLVGASSFDGRVRGLLQEVYAQGWSWMGTYMHHEHPTHSSGSHLLARLPTTSGSN